MSSFSVLPTDVSVAGASLSGISDEVITAASTVGSASGAADGTNAADAFEGVLDRFSSVLPQYAAVGAALSTALGAAATAYRTADQGVSQACETGGRAGA